MQAAKPQFIILLLLVSFGSVGAVLFTPALPTIKNYFQLSVGQAQFTITSYLIGYALGQLPYGPLANRFGRKVALYMGISLAIFGSLLCVLASPVRSFVLFIVARFLQALGASVGLKVSFTMIGDVYDQVNAAKRISLISLSFAIIPGLAVAIGGWLTSFLNWESCFFFLSLYGAFILYLCKRLPETAKSLDLHALKGLSILRGYGLKFKNSRLVVSGLMMGCGTAVIYLFASKSPFIGINVIGLTPKAFGNYNLIPLIGMLLGIFVTTKLAGRVSMLTILLSSIGASLIMTLSMLVPFLLGQVTAWTLFFPMILIYFTETVIYANVSSYGLSTAKNKSNGSAVLNFINLGTTVIAVVLSEFIFPESVIVLPLSFILSFSSMFVLWIFLKKLD